MAISDTSITWLNTYFTSWKELPNGENAIPEYVPAK